MDIEKDVLSLAPEAAVDELKKKTISVPTWEELEKEYDVMKHPVMTDTSYIDVAKDGEVDKVSRILQGLQKVAAERMTGLMFGIPVKRVYKAISEKEAAVAKVLEKILQRNRINSVNIERGDCLFAGCEVATLWYAVEEQNSYYGIDSRLKLRCKSFSPMNGELLYPFFDEYGDMVAMSFGYTRKDGDQEVEYLDTYTSTKHIRYKKVDAWVVDISEVISTQKIPAIYTNRPTPIWENLSSNVYEIEWALSRNGNYLRRNSKPLVAVFADQEINAGGEKSEKREFRSVFQYPKGSDVKYVTWEQAVENLKFYITKLEQSFFAQLQLPDTSFENMKSTPMSGEARKMMFVDSFLKVTRESGRFYEFMDREINVVKSFLKIIMPSHANEVDSLQVELVITPFTIADDKDTINNIITATGGKPVMSQRQGVEYLGWSDDVDKTMQELREQALSDVGEPTL